MKEKKFKVYLFTFPNGKQYCGFTSQSLSKRWNNGNGYQKCPLIWRAIQKYGWENITKTIIFSSENKELALEKEKEYIAQLKLTNQEFGYNLHEGGKPTGAGDFLTNEGRKKISENSKRNWKDPEYIEKMKQRKIVLYQFTEEDRRKAALAHKGKIPHNALPVLQIDIKTDEIIKEFPSATHAAIAVINDKIGCSNILSVCKQKRKTAYGYKWRFKE